MLLSPCRTVAVVLASLIWTAFVATARAEVKPELEIRNDVTYATADGQELKLDLAWPKGLDRAVPAIVMIHGGGWSGGKRQDMAGFMREAGAHGYVSATISYRLTPKHPFPAQIEDVKAAVRYLRANASDLKIDPNQIGALGVSAGAHLAMMLGTMDRGDGLEGNGGNSDQSSKVQAVVSFVGPCNLVRNDYSEAATRILQAFVAGDPAEKKEVCRQASPITYVSKGDAPMLLFFGTKDPLISFDQAFEMATALTAAEVPARVELIVGAGHGWLGEEMTRTIHASLAFFDDKLKP